MSITIAIPFYNAEKYLTEAVRSVFAQTYQDWELILIDDGSTDNSLKIAKSINDPRVRVISDGKNKKLATRLNEVTKLAKFDYIARMDADDLISPNRLEIQMKFLKENPDYDLISTGTYSILNNKKLVGYRGWVADTPRFNQILKKEIGVLHASIVAKREWYERNLYNENLPLAQDSDMWLRTSKNKDLKIKIIPDLLYIYREEGNITSQKMLKAYKIERTIFSKYIDSELSKSMYVFKSYLKSIIVVSLNKAGFLNSILHKKRNSNSIDSEHHKDYQSILAKINATKIPGIDK